MLADARRVATIETSNSLAMPPPQLLDVSKTQEGIVACAIRLPHGPMHTMRLIALSPSTCVPQTLERH
jgi:hypothetical protein